MKGLWLNRVSMDNDVLCFTLSHCVDQVEALSLQSCGITDEIVEQLAEKIKQRQNPVKCYPVTPNLKFFVVKFFIVAFILNFCHLRYLKYGWIGLYLENKMFKKISVFYCKSASASLLLDPAFVAA